MRILIFNWKDLGHPLAGGAELVTQRIAERWVQWGHQVDMISGRFPDAPLHTIDRGVDITRVGKRYSVYWLARREYIRRARHAAYDVVIDEINTMPFFTPLYVRQPIVALVFQLCREIWFYQMPFPLSWVGYALEPLYLQFYRHVPVLTASRSTQQDLHRYGFKTVDVFPVGIDVKPLTKVPPKDEPPYLLFVGRIVPMKRPHAVIEALGYLGQPYERVQLKLIGAGDPRYIQTLKERAAQYGVAKRVEFLGRVSEVQKHEYMKRALAITVSSVKEGWGLIVTEANALGTLAVVYNVDGLRDAVVHQSTGLICTENTPEALARQVMELLESPGLYGKLCQNALEHSWQFTWERSAQKALELLQSAIAKRR